MDKADETTDNNIDDKANDDFQKMLDLAEFGVKRMEERRSVEFRIFISYMTLLILALYQLIKPSSISIELWIRELIKPEPTPNELRIEGIQAGLLYLIALSIHFIYVMWQVGLGIAMNYDAYRRNFYLRKAECISGHPLNYSCEICSSDNEIVPIKKYRQQFKYLWLILGDWSRMLLIVIPTFLFIIIVDLFIKKADWPPWIRLIAISVEFLLFGVLITASTVQNRGKTKVNK